MVLLAWHFLVAAKWSADVCTLAASAMVALNNWVILEAANSAGRLGITWFTCRMHAFNGRCPVARTKVGWGSETGLGKMGCRWARSGGGNGRGGVGGVRGGYVRGWGWGDRSKGGGRGGGGGGGASGRGGCEDG
jgi:hypothetical protein